MKENKLLIFVLVLLTLLISVMIYIPTQVKKYEVEVMYCDERPKKIVVVKSLYEPTVRCIRTHKQVVPRFYGEVNVCGIKVLGEIK